MTNGWIKLHRALKDKAIWKCSTPEQKSILITLLMMANHEPKEWEWKGKKFMCNPGQMITSLESIKEEAGKGISIQGIRTSLQRFQNLEFLTNESTKTGRLVTIINWESYQSNKKNQQSNQQRPNKELTTNKNDKNVRNKYIVEKNLHLTTKIIEYLNNKIGSQYRPDTFETQKHINGRLAEGYKFTDFKKVVDLKVAQWKGDSKMKKFLRPNTLFNQSKFESYLNEPYEECQEESQYVELH